MSADPPIDADTVRAHLDYDPETGAFLWRIRGRGRRRGANAGSHNLADGYRHVSVGGRSYAAHRLAWLHVHGEWPDGPIDHINGDRGDNRIANLRVVTPAINAQNQRRPKVTNASGYLGVFVTPAGSYIAQIGVAGKDIRLGRFPTAVAASEAYLSAKRRLHAGCTI